MSTQDSFYIGKHYLCAVLAGLLIVTAGCAKTKQQEVAPPPAPLAPSSSIVTGSIPSSTQSVQDQSAQKSGGTVTRVKTASLRNTRTAVATRTDKNKISLAFPKKGYALSGTQSARLASFVRDAKARKKRVKIIGIAAAKRGGKRKSAMNKAREEASRRAKATSMFLRVYGLETKDMTITTADQSFQKGVNSRRVEVVLQ